MAKPETKAQHHAQSTIPLESIANAVMMKRLRVFGLSLSLAGLLLAGLAWGISSWAESHKNIRLTQLQDVQARLIDELSTLNQGATIPEPRGLQTVLAIGKNIDQGNPGWLLRGQLYEQKLKYFLTQLIETLSRPISGLDADTEKRLQREISIRVEALPRLEKLREHIESATTGISVLLMILAAFPGLAGLFLLSKWLFHLRIDGYKRRINTLSRAIHSQDKLEMQRLGASNALEGLMAVLDKTRNIEHRQALLQIGQQLEELKESGHRVLDFANSFHRLSSHATSLARSALTNEQRNLKADGTIDIVKTQLDGLREDMRNAAQGLRKAGQVSRQLMANLQHPEQLELDLTDPNLNSLLQSLVEQSQHALKEAIEGMVLASQKINMGQFEANKLAEHLAVNHTAWSNLLEEIEQHAESASNESAEALKLAKKLIQNSRENAASIESAKNSGPKPGQAQLGS